LGVQNNRYIRRTWTCTRHPCRQDSCIIKQSWVGTFRTFVVSGLAVQQWLQTTRTRPGHDPTNITTARRTALLYSKGHAGTTVQPLLHFGDALKLLVAFQASDQERDGRAYDVDGSGTGWKRCSEPLPNQKQDSWHFYGTGQADRSTRLFVHQQKCAIELHCPKTSPEHVKSLLLIKRMSRRPALRIRGLGE